MKKNGFCDSIPGGGELSPTRQKREMVVTREGEPFGKEERKGHDRMLSAGLINRLLPGFTGK